MNSIDTCKNGIYLGLGISASPLIVGTLLTTTNVIRSIVAGFFISSMTGGAYTTAFNAVFSSPRIWILTYYTSSVGLPIAAVSLLALVILSSKELLKR